MRSRPMSSSSAAICASAVRMPWPISTLPGLSSTKPSGSKRSQRDSRGLAFRLTGSCAAGGHVGLLGRAQHRPHDAVVGAAAAQVAIERGAHLAFAGVGIALQQRGGGDQDARECSSRTARPARR